MWSRDDFTLESVRHAIYAMPIHMKKVTLSTQTICKQLALHFNYLVQEKPILMNELEKKCGLEKIGRQRKRKVGYIGG